MSDEAPAMLNVDDPAAIERLLFSPDAVMRMKGRAMANGWPSAMSKWIEAEAPGNETPVMMAVVLMFLDTYASMEAHFCRPGGEERCADLLAKIVRAGVPDKIVRIRAAIAAEVRP